MVHVLQRKLQLPRASKNVVNPETEGCAATATFRSSAYATLRTTGRDVKVVSPPGEALELEAVIAALREVACTAPLQDGLRRCCVCGAAFATPLRMRDHLSGRRHCTAVAMQFSSDRGLSSCIDNEEAHMGTHMDIGMTCFAMREVQSDRRPSRSLNPIARQYSKTMQARSLEFGFY
eukprot:Skav206160  [mRNA]  locus=scaffold1545:214895:223642:- [translate_table: standard]